MKVELVQEHAGGFYSDGRRPWPLKRTLPFYVNGSRWRRSRYVHRVRSGFWYRQTEHNPHGHATVRLWCGQSGFLSGSRCPGELLATIPDDPGLVLCGTCEGRAIGAGLEPAAFLIQLHELRFAPREIDVPVVRRTEAASS